ncbi:VWA domain-containing protein [Indiicoccus explosivorum]|uniref:VWA domain-containing protein n=1 Tax=Indiicoccus explosivorum TaxID=1917864 RepID=UPI000B44918E|nr:VWA domain-containing protein [Indiicoccus explosivorum]
MELRADEPLLLLVPLTAALYFLWIALRGFRQWRKLKRLVFGMRAAAVLLLAFALSEPYWHLPAKQEQILFLADRSASVQSADRELYTAIAEAAEEKRADQQVGVFAFAEDFQTVSPVGSEGVLGSEVGVTDKGTTDIAGALHLAAAAVPAGVPARIVLMSDGNETAGSALKTIELLDSGNLSIDVFPIGGEAGPETAIEEFGVPDRAVSGETLELELAISANGATVADLIIFREDEEVKRQHVRLNEGRNEFTLEVPASGEGLLKFEAVIVPETDTFTENNRMLGLTEVEGRPHFLVVSEEGGSPISRLLDTDTLQVSGLPVRQLPSSLSSLLEYDAVIFDNVPATSLSSRQMDIIEQGVRNFGLGFMMTGGDQSFGLGGYFKTPIERLLPVDMEVTGKHQLPSLGLIIVMDRSGSMGGMKLELAKEAAARSVEMLRPDDTLGVIAFDDRPWEIYELQKVGDPEEAVDRILSITPGGGTEIFTPLASAYSQLEGVEAQRKHIILLTDGQSSLPAAYEETIREGMNDGISLSTVAIGQDSDRVMLETMAEAGNGRFYNVADATTIPAILSRETAMLSRTYIVDDPFYPVIYESYWSGLFSAGVPQMNAYIATTAKPAATVAAESPEEDPILAEWNYGIGRTIAYTSGSGPWSGGFAAWDLWPEFWNRTAARLLPAYREVPFIVTRDSESGYVIEDPTGNSAVLTVHASDEAGKEIAVRTEPIGPGKVRVTLEDADAGLAFLSIENEREDVFRTAITIPYAEEYRAAAIDRELLEQLADRSGGQVLTDLSDAMRDIPFTGGTRQPATRLFILLAMFLFFTDITIRRFAGFRIVRTGNGKNEPPAEETSIDQLIKAKKRR